MHLSRKVAVSSVLILTFIAGNIPSILSYGAWSDITILLGKNIFDSFDFISGNIFFVLTALASSIFVGWVLGNDAKKELSNGSSSQTIINLWLYYVKFIMPIVIVIIFIYGIRDFFL